MRDGLVRPDIFHLIAHTRQILLKSVLRDYHRAAAIIRVKTEGFGIFETAIEEEYHMMFGIINQSEWTHAPRLQTQVFHHPFRGRKRQLTG